MSRMHTSPAGALLEALRAIDISADPDLLIERARDARVVLPIESGIHHRMAPVGALAVNGTRAFYVPEHRHDELARIVKRLME